MTGNPTAAGELDQRQAERRPLLAVACPPPTLSIGVLRLSTTMSFSEWVSAGQRLARISQGAAWALGDWLLFGQAHYGERYRNALSVTQFDYQTLRNYAWVARSVPPSRRRDGLSFQHHAEVASLSEAEQELWLGRAERLGWSRNRLRRELADRRRRRRPEPPSSAVVVRIAVAAQREERWRQAANAAAQCLEEWLAHAVDVAADDILSASGPGAPVTIAAMPVHVALVDASGTVSSADLAEVAGALNQQVQADFAPVWQLAATVGAYPSAPAGTWRIELRKAIPGGGLGFHSSAYNQPFALVDVDAGQWTVTASHELLEMLGDPWGNRLHTAAAPAGWAGTSPRVRYLVELCDPCAGFTYEVGGVAVSDFLLPSFYRSSSCGVNRYSHSGALTEPLQVAEGGYFSFVDPADDHIWQRYRTGGQVQDKDWGPQQLEAEMLRERVDSLSERFLFAAKGGSG